MQAISDCTFVCRLLFVMLVIRVCVCAKLLIIKEVLHIHQLFLDLYMTSGISREPFEGAEKFLVVENSVSNEEMTCMLHRGRK